MNPEAKITFLISSAWFLIFFSNRTVAFLFTSLFAEKNLLVLGYVANAAEWVATAVGCLIQPFASRKFGLRDTMAIGGAAFALANVGVFTVQLESDVMTNWLITMGFGITSGILAANFWIGSGVYMNETIKEENRSFWLSVAFSSYSATGVIGGFTASILLSFIEPWLVIAILTLVCLLGTIPVFFLGSLSKVKPDHKKQASSAQSQLELVSEDADEDKIEIIGNGTKDTLVQVQAKFEVDQELENVFEKSQMPSGWQKSIVEFSESSVSPDQSQDSSVSAQEEKGNKDIVAQLERMGIAPNVLKIAQQVTRNGRKTSIFMPGNIRPKPYILFPGYIFAGMFNAFRVGILQRMIFLTVADGGSDAVIKISYCLSTLAAGAWLASPIAGKLSEVIGDGRVYIIGGVIWSIAGVSVIILSLLPFSWAWLAASFLNGVGDAFQSSILQKLVSTHDASPGVAFMRYRFIMQVSIAISLIFSILTLETIPGYVFVAIMLLVNIFQTVLAVHACTKYQRMNQMPVVSAIQRRESYMGVSQYNINQKWVRKKELRILWQAIIWMLVFFSMRTVASLYTTIFAEWGLNQLGLIATSVAWLSSAVGCLATQSIIDCIGLRSYMILGAGAYLLLNFAAILFYSSQIWSKFGLL